LSLNIYSFQKIKFMRKIFVFVFVLTFSLSMTFGQNIYNPAANASEELAAAVRRASSENKHILVQVGGNWCSWCLKLHKFFKSELSVDSIIQQNYVFLLINYSKENKNLDILEKFEFPQRFGFPVLLILDKTGKRLHTQDTSLLEENEGYSVKKVKDFLKQWTAAALKPELYKK